MDKNLASSFNKIADDYDRYRSGYDTAVINAIVERVTTGNKACEVGTGTGLGTYPFAERGFEITCVEPGAALLAKAKERLQAFAGISYMNANFEEVALPIATYDLVFSAQAFGWVDQSIAYQRAASILKKGGLIAVFYKRTLPVEDPRKDEMDLLIKQYIPSFEPWTVTKHERNLLADFKLLVESDCFEWCELRRYPAPPVPPQSPCEVAEGLGTWSAVALLPPKERRDFIEKARALMEQQQAQEGNLTSPRDETTLMLGVRR